MIQHFPEHLNQYLDKLSRIEQYALNEEEEQVFTEITLRIQESIKKLELKNTEAEPIVKEKKHRRTKPPRANK